MQWTPRFQSFSLTVQSKSRFSQRHSHDCSLNDWRRRGRGRRWGRWGRCPCGRTFCLPVRVERMLLPLLTIFPPFFASRRLLSSGRHPDCPRPMPDYIYLPILLRSAEKLKMSCLWWEGEMYHCLSFLLIKPPRCCTLPVSPRRLHFPTRLGLSCGCYCSATAALETANKLWTGTVHSLLSLQLLSA